MCRFCASFEPQSARGSGMTCRIKWVRLLSAGGVLDLRCRAEATLQSNWVVWRSGCSCLEADQIEIQPVADRRHRIVKRFVLTVGVTNLEDISVLLVYDFCPCFCWGPRDGEHVGE